MSNPKGIEIEELKELEKLETEIKNLERLVKKD